LTWHHYQTVLLPPNPHAAAVLGLTLAALFLFSREKIPLETSSLLVLVTLTVGFELFPYSDHGQRLHALGFFSGFGHEALVAVSALMVAGQGLIRTGALEPVGRFLSRMWSVVPRLSFLLTLIIGAALSAFVNNVPIVILLLPILVGVALRTKTHAYKVLMPMGFATLIGGMSTTIGTSTNLLVVSVAEDMGMHHLQMFDFALPVAIAGGVALLYLWLIAPHLVPHRKTQLDDRSPRVFSAQLNIPDDSFADGRPLSEIIDKAGKSMRVNRIRRGDDTFLQPLPDVIVRAGDQLLVNDTPDNLKEYEQVLGAELYSGGEPVDEDHPLHNEDQQLAEIVVTQGSLLEDSTLARSRFADRYQLIPLAIHRAGPIIRTMESDISDTQLQTGDVLLVQGARDQIAEFKRTGQLLVLDATADVPKTKRAPLALMIMAGIVLVAAFGIMPIAISAVAGVMLMLFTRCLHWRDATAALSVQVIMIVAASLALGVALLKTGGADYLARLFVDATQGASPRLMLSGLMILMAVVTNIVSNNAAAVIGTPIAVGIARQVSMPVEPFVLAVVFGANMSFATPMAYKTNLLIMCTGGYRFSDFMRVGIPLTAIMWLIFSWLLPVLYELD
jgi:di/tricarboxylate transporter